MNENQDQTPNVPTENRAVEVHELREAELQMTGHAPVATHFAGWGSSLPANAQGDQAASANGDHRMPAVTPPIESGSQN
jgi:hypothetical protein